MTSANDILSEDPSHINRWGATQKVRWRNSRVDFSLARGFCLRYSSNPHEVHPHEVVRSWRETSIHPSSSRPSSGSSVSSFRSHASRSSHRSAVSYSDTEIRENELLKVPYDLVLCEDYLMDYAYDKDPSFGLLLCWIDERHQKPASLKYKMTVFLCMAYARLKLLHRQIPSHITDSEVWNPWFEYVAFLPRLPSERLEFNFSWENSLVPLTVPTAWPEEDQKYLDGTSLELSVPAKMRSLESNFRAFWGWAAGDSLYRWATSVTLNDWIRFDACYISRSLETLDSGVCMVPCLDMVNHSYKPNAHFVQDPDNGDISLMKYDGTLGINDEITINYASENGAGEFLLKYGFIDPNISFNDRLTLLLPGIPLEDRARLNVVQKLQAIERVGGNNRVTIRQNSEGEADWESPFAYLLALDEEDGLVFKSGYVPPDSSYCTEVLLRNQDISDELLRIEEIIKGHPRERSIRWRAVKIVMSKVELQITELEGAPKITDELARNPRIAMCRRLRELEMGSLMAIRTELRKQASALRPGLQSTDTGEIPIVPDDQMSKLKGDGGIIKP